MFTSAVRSRSASVITARRAGLADAHTHVFVAGPGGLFRIGAHRVDIGRSVIESDWPGEVQHVVDDAVEARDLFVDVGQGLRDSARLTPSRDSVRSDALMIISGFRISCAITVDRRPSADSRSRCAASRWKRAIESVSVLNVAASSFASSSSQLAARPTEIFRVRSPVADISRITSVIVATGRVIVRATA